MVEADEDDITQARADMLDSLNNDDAVKNAPRFLARMERLTNIIINDALRGYQRKPFRFD